MTCRRGASGPDLDRLIAHGRPGNVGELGNVIDRAIAIVPGTALR
jgi:DNA-binding NtrC family response regulator